MGEDDDSGIEGTDSWMNRRLSVRTVLIGFGALVAVVALVVGAVVVLGGDDADANEVVLESVDSAGIDPFLDSIATDAVDPDGIEAGGVAEVSTNADAPVAQISGETPGLYGGTGDQAACDAAALVEFLDDNPDKAGAFAQALGIEPDAIGDYVAALTPVVLREDTRVTNHGFSNGQPTPFQSVLQAGTAVLVDQRGVPRVRCACGNPLTEPEGSTTDLAFTGDPWGGFDQTRLVAVEPAPRELDTLTVTDLATGDPQQVDTGTSSTTSDDDEAAASGSGEGMTVERMLNVELPDLENDLLGPTPGQLVDGVGPTNEFGEPGPFVAGSPGAQAPSQSGEPEVYIGDITGDGVDDGLVQATQVFGASTVIMATYLYNSDGTFLDAVDADDLGGTYEFPTIEGDTLTFEVLTLGPNDPRCCPTVQSTVRFRWNGTEFELA